MRVLVVVVLVAAFVRGEQVKACGGWAPDPADGLTFYNITWYGNARSMLEMSHQDTRDTNAAIKWYKRAFELSKNKETKAKAAFLASKAELGVLLSKMDPYDQPYPLPVPTTWFTALKKLDDTKYYKDVLKECGAFRDWAGKHK